jgi:hypothetical protein
MESKRTHRRSNRKKSALTAPKQSGGPLKRAISSDLKNKRDEEKMMAEFEARISLSERNVSQNQDEVASGSY